MLPSPDDPHYVVFKEGGWEIEHSAACRNAGTMLGCGLWAELTVGVWLAGTLWRWPDWLTCLAVLAVQTFAMPVCIAVGVLLVVIVSPASPEFDADYQTAAGTVRRRSDSEAVRR